MRIKICSQDEDTEMRKKYERKIYEREKQLKKLTVMQREVLQLLKNAYLSGLKFVTTSQIAQELNLKNNQVIHITKKLKEKGFIKNYGNKKGRWAYVPITNTKVKRKLEICRHLTTKGGRYYCPVFGFYVGDIHMCIARYGIMFLEDEVVRIKFSRCKGFSFKEDVITCLNRARYCDEIDGIVFYDKNPNRENIQKTILV